VTSQPSLAEALRAGQSTFGGWCVIPNAFSAEVLAQRGFDWVGIDWQHGFMGQETSAAMIQAISLSRVDVLVRVGFNDPMVIMKALDMGATGVIVPLVNDRREAEAAVAACRYPPAGRRSYGPVRNAQTIGVEPELCNERVLCVAMIETADGFANVEEICATPGLDGVYIGPDDLRISLNATNGDSAGAVDKIIDACKRHEIVAGLHAATGDEARRLSERGVQLVGIATDADFLAGYADQELIAARGAAADTVAAPGDRLVRTVVWSGL
jgi:4-hydroxy-2-oxoheptanedioate aldolase